MSIKLPKEFKDLQPFAERWARATEYERAAELGAPHPRRSRRSTGRYSSASPKSWSVSINIR